VDVQNEFIRRSIFEGEWLGLSGWQTRLRSKRAVDGEGNEIEQ